jgi:mRNA-degrading endonuclease RelE of RelBE toxin-antitoxin system
MKVFLTAEVRKQLEKIPRNQRSKIYRKFEVLGENPGIGKKLKGEMADKHSLRAWPYRILYILDRNKDRILVVSIAHRQGIYK